MSQRGGYSDKVSTNRKAQGTLGRRYNKKNIYQDHFESQDIWKNLDRIRHSNRLAGKTIKNSYLCLRLQKKSDLTLLTNCIEELHKYIEHDTLELQKQSESTAILILKKFSILDCCLTLAVISNLTSGRTLNPAGKSYFTVPNDIELNCSMFVFSNFKHVRSRQRYSRENSNFNISISPISLVQNISEIRISTSAGKNLPTFMQGLANFVSELKFGKHLQGIDKYISKCLGNPRKRLTLGLAGLRFPAQDMFDPSELEINRQLLSQSKERFTKYKADIQKYKESLLQTSTETSVGNVGSVSKTETTTYNNTNAIVQSNDSSRFESKKEIINLDHTRGTSTSHQLHPEKRGFLTQEQIKEHCIANISASRDIVKSKDGNEIFKMYIRIPKLKYIDMIYQNLNDFRSRTNCNIVVLNLNNLAESEPWLASLDLGKYTSITQSPHPSTVRVVSIGGVSEYILNTLDLISDIMKS
ncbi:similar to Saccharomyces cerevisiae YDR240C SNU56 Component of U1 snRNP required for mRNA splicing via spliceosome [Maudiozyma saulgeensis]|uniref:Similar to Saccharomyces cerevisiae YDR240C SNU56 Component of U1 snRNP required for mRNA splicing via spliceosome n=1 Tax=Maudiozyma saulgeensis TaxID=1789683 RepID=A0A1X7R5I4_9SACH|nr:similar to Saccharomyces cerevisiae YDR240C SNU56 Component of U1 snRNP required for mRNA splicing via spliceosome [Kazachstania saulgeensis]